MSDPRRLMLERFPIVTRGGSTVQSAWRLVAESEEGPGAIVFVEASPEETFYRGEGVFLGWTQERLEAVYRALLPNPESDGFEMQQMG